MTALRRTALVLSLVLLLALLLPAAALAAPIRMYNIWATWCGPCIKELPDLGRIARDYAGRIELIGVQDDAVYDDWTEDPAAIAEGKALLSDSNATYTNLVPIPSLAYLYDGLSAFPTTRFVGSGDKVLHTAVGSRSYSSWSSVIDAVLESQTAASLPGDASDNGKLAVNDLEDMVDWIVRSFPPASPANANPVTGDGINLQDALWLIEKLIAG